MPERIFALLLLGFLSPLLLILYILVKLTSRGPFIFIQKRAGKDKKPFLIYKIRTMVEGAEKQRTKLKNFNEADEPAFKIHNDPRYTKIGKLISHTALDEIPQLINVIKGEMSIVGPRPLPVNEATKVPRKYKKRFSVLPGMTSLWITRGADHSSFKKWMELDLYYVNNKGIRLDMKIFWQTILLIMHIFLNSLRPND